MNVLYTALQHSHSGLRYLVLLLLVVVLIKSLVGWLSKAQYQSLDDRLSLFLFISVHLQLTLGLILYVGSAMGWMPGKVNFAMASESATIRYYTYEHITANLIAIVLITLGRTRSRRILDDSTARFRTLFLYTFVGTVVLVVSLVATSGPGLFGKS